MSPFIFKVPPGFKELVKLFANDAAVSDRFGANVAVDGNVAVIGAGGKTISNNSSAGAAYIYEKVSNVWTFVKRINASDRAAGDLFGSTVAISGNTIVVGARGEDPSGISGAGSAYVFEKSGTWPTTETQKLAGKAAFDEFGSTLAISGNTIVVGARSADVGGESNSGAAWVYEKSTSWLEVKKLVASDGLASDGFGSSVGISGDTIIVGSQSSDPLGSSSGSAYVFEKSGTWPGTETQKLVASDGIANALFGSAADIEGTTIVIGASGDDPGFVNGAGSAYVFEKSGTWIEVQKLVASDGFTSAQFGITAAISGNTIAIGSPTGVGGVYIFKKSGTWSSSEIQKVVSSDGISGDDFAYFIDLSGNVLLVGAHNADPNGIDNAGRAYIFED